MQSFCVYYSNLTIEKKILTVLFCPCVTIYYLIYNSIKQFVNLLTYICEECLSPVFNCITRMITYFLEKLCGFLDLIFEILIQCLNKICNCIGMICDRILLCFKPILIFFSSIFTCLSNIFTFFSNIFTFLCNKFEDCLQKIYDCIEYFCQCISMLFEACLLKINDFCCQPICNFFNMVFLKIIEVIKNYVVNPIVCCTNALINCLSKLLSWGYRVFIKPIIDYIILPICNLLTHIYDCFRDYFCIVIYRIFKSIFGFIYQQLANLFSKITSVLIEVKNVFLNLFVALFVQGDKRQANVKGIGTKKITHKNKWAEDEDLENGNLQYDVSHNNSEHIFCVNRDIDIP